MSIAIAIWSLELVPGKEQIVVPQGDVRISNAALGEIIQDQDARTVVKLTYTKLGEEDSDEDDEEEKEYDESLSSLVLCALTAGKIENAQVDLVLEEGTPYKFEAVGKNSVSLSGNYIGADQPPFGEDDSDSDDDDAEDAYDLRDVSSDVEMDPSVLDGIASDDDEGRFEEVKDEVEPPKPAKRAREADEKAEKPSKAEKKKNKKLKKDNGEAVPVGNEEVKVKPAEAKAEKKREKKEGKADKEGKQTQELKGGLKVEDSVTGTGPQAKKGDKLQMRYIGKLQSGKVFDKSVKGGPFKFTLGAGEVIKGWDEGLVGMQVGGERKLIIPPQLAYGKRGSKPDIPPNATLIFEVKLIGIN